VLAIEEEGTDARTGEGLLFAANNVLLFFFSTENSLLVVRIFHQIMFLVFFYVKPT
jgi:hypothetical protein